MVSRKDSNRQRLKRHVRVRAKISGSAERPRLSVYRSENHISAQLIDDVKGVTLCSATSKESAFGGKGSNKEAAAKVGKLLAERAAGKGHRGSGVRPERLPLSRQSRGTGRRRP